MAATQTEIIAERRKEKKRAEARGEGDMVEGYDPVVPPPPNVAPPLPPEAEGYDPVVDPPRPVYKGFKAPPGMTADQRQRWQQSVDTRLSGKEDRALERGKQDTEDLLRGIGAQAGKVYGDLDEMATKALQYPVKFARDPMGESEKLSGTAIEMGKGLAQTAAAPLELSADITAGRTTPRAVEKQASDMAKRYARALSSGDIEETNKAIAELSAASSLADPTPASELVYAGSQFIDGNVADGMASLLAIVALGGAGAYSIQEAKKALKKGMTDKGVDAASAEKVADKAVEKAWLMRREGYESPLSAEEARRKADTMSFAQQEADAAYGQQMTEAKAARQAELDRLEAEALAQFKAREAAKVADEQAKVAAAKAEEKAQVDKQRYAEKQRELEAQRKAEAEDVSDEPTVSEPFVEDTSDMPTSPTALTQTKTRRAEAQANRLKQRQSAIRRGLIERRKLDWQNRTKQPTPATAAKPEPEAPKAEAPKAEKPPGSGRSVKDQADEMQSELERMSYAGQMESEGMLFSDADDLVEDFARKYPKDVYAEVARRIKAGDTRGSETFYEIADPDDYLPSGGKPPGGKPAPTKATTSEAPDLSKKTIKQLKAYAKSEGISLGSARRKADILRRIEEGSDAGSAIDKARKEAQQPPKKKAKKADPEPDPDQLNPGRPDYGGTPRYDDTYTLDDYRADIESGYYTSGAVKPPGGGDFGPAPKTRKVKVRTTGRDAPDDIQRSGDVSETATFVETEPVRGARTSAPFKIQKSPLTESMSRYRDPRNRTEFPTLGALADHATNLVDKLEGVPPSAIRRQFDKIRVNIGVSRIGEGTGPTKAVVGGKKTALSGPQEVLSKTGELSRRRGVKTKARVAERDLVAVETAYNEMADSARLVKKSQSDLDDAMKTAGEMGISSEQYMQPYIRLLEEYEASVKKYEELSGAFAKRFL